MGSFSRGTGRFRLARVRGSLVSLPVGPPRRRSNSGWRKGRRTTAASPADGSEASPGPSEPRRPAANAPGSWGRSSRPRRGCPGRAQQTRDPEDYRRVAPSAAAPSGSRRPLATAKRSAIVPEEWRDAPRSPKAFRGWGGGPAGRPEPDLGSAGGDASAAPAPPAIGRKPIHLGPEASAQGQPLRFIPKGNHLRPAKARVFPQTARAGN